MYGHPYVFRIKCIDSLLNARVDVTNIQTVYTHIKYIN